MQKALRFSVELRNQPGHANLNPPQYRVQPIIDEPPSIQVEEPAKDVELTPQRRVTPLVARASDDVALAQVELSVKRESDQHLTIQSLKKYTGLVANDTLMMSLDAAKFARGNDALVCRLRVTDRKGQAVESPEFRLIIRGDYQAPDKSRERVVEQRNNLIDKLRQLAEQHRQTTEELQKLAPEKPAAKPDSEPQKRDQKAADAMAKQDEPKAKAADPGKPKVDSPQVASKGPDSARKSAGKGICQRQLEPKQVAKQLQELANREERRKPRRASWPGNSTGRPRPRRPERRHPRDSRRCKICSAAVTCKLRQNAGATTDAAPCRRSTAARTTSGRRSRRFKSVSINWSIALAWKNSTCGGRQPRQGSDIAEILARSKPRNWHRRRPKKQAFKLARRLEAKRCSATVTAKKNRQRPRRRTTSSCRARARTEQLENRAVETLQGQEALGQAECRISARRDAPIRQGQQTQARQQRRRKGEPMPGNRNPATRRRRDRQQRQGRARVGQTNKTEAEGKPMPGEAGSGLTLKRCALTRAAWRRGPTAVGLRLALNRSQLEQRQRMLDRDLDRAENALDAGQQLSRRWSRSARRQANPAIWPRSLRARNAATAVDGRPNEPRREPASQPPSPAASRGTLLGRITSVLEPHSANDTDLATNLAGLNLLPRVMSCCKAREEAAAQLQQFRTRLQPTV